jgi:nitrate reductase NapE component
MFTAISDTQLLAGSSAFAALIWWVVPVTGLIGGIGYVVWVSKYKAKFESETSRSVNQFQKFQESFREPSSRDQEPNSNQAF